MAAFLEYDPAKSDMLRIPAKQTYCRVDKVTENGGISMMKSGYSILVVEDNITTAKTLRLFLQSEGYSVDWAATGLEGLKMFRSASPDLVLLDLMMPDMDGIAVCREIRQHNATPIVMLTAKTTEDEIVNGLEAGANDYICKPFGSKELLARIRRCLLSLRPAEETGSIIRIGDISLDLEKREVLIGGEAVKLTKSEFEILALLMNNPDRVFTRDQIIDGALGPDFNGFDRTIDTHIWSLRKKMREPRGAPRYIQSELGVGYRLRDADAY